MITKNYIVTVSITCTTTMSKVEDRYGKITQDYSESALEDIKITVSADSRAEAIIKADRLLHTEMTT